MSRRKSVIIALPPDVDELTDEENFDGDEMTTPLNYRHGYRKYVYSVFNLTNCEKESINDRRYITIVYLKRGANSKKGIERTLMMSSRSNIIDSVCLDRKDHVIGKRKSQRRCQFQKCKHCSKF
ncbi:UNVERIFIED_CONTAM: hypothetical protein NCL1_34937 [Trichonephila clavipes]